MAGSSVAGAIREAIEIQCFRWCSWKEQRPARRARSRAAPWRDLQAIEDQVFDRHGGRRRNSPARSGAPARASSSGTSSTWRAVTCGAAAGALRARRATLPARAPRWQRIPHPGRKVLYARGPSASCSAARGRRWRTRRGPASRAASPYRWRARPTAASAAGGDPWSSRETTAPLHDIHKMNIVRRNHHGILSLRMS